jgi:hypothetical protein
MPAFHRTLLPSNHIVKICQKASLSTRPTQRKHGNPCRFSSCLLKSQTPLWVTFLLFVWISADRLIFFDTFVHRL